jgi:hypothetical protein
MGTVRVITVGSEQKRSSVDDLPPTEVFLTSGCLTSMDCYNCRLRRAESQLATVFLHQIALVNGQLTTFPTVLLFPSLKLKIQVNKCCVQGSNTSKWVY